MTGFNQAGEAPAIGVAATRFGRAAVLVTAAGFRVIEFLEGDETPEARIPPFPRGVSPRALAGEDANRVAEAMECVTAARRLPLDPVGTGFQKAVWQAVRDVPAGFSASYGSIATAIGRPSAARAVAAACAANRLAVAVPCHRVFSSAGAATGYRWGLDRRRAILSWEDESSVR